MRALLTIICWVVAINLGMVCSDGNLRSFFRDFFKGGGLAWGYLCMNTVLFAIPLVLALLIGLLGRWLGLRRTWRTILSGMASGVIVLVFNIALDQVNGGSIALNGIFLIAGGSVGFSVRARPSQEVGSPKKSEK